MKKKLILLCVLCLLVSMLSVGAYADGKPTITVSSTTAVAGGNAMIYVTATNFDNITGVRLVFNTSNPDVIFTTGRVVALGGARATVTPTEKLILLSTEGELEDGQQIVSINFRVPEGLAAGTVIDLGTTITAMTRGVNDINDLANETEVAAKGTITIIAELPDHSGHEIVHHEYVEETCTEPGANEYWECVDEGKYYDSEELVNEIAEDSWIRPVKDHYLVEHAAVAATCSEEGNKAYQTCMYEHVFADPETGIEGSDAYFDMDGQFLGRGNVPTDIKELVTPKIPHTFDGALIPLVEATDTKDGVIAHYVCTVCEAAYADAEKNEIEEDDLYFKPQYRINQTELSAADAADLKAAADAKGYTDGTVAYDVTPQGIYDNSADHWVARKTIPAAGLEFTIALPTGVDTAKLSQYKFYVQHQGAGIDELTTFEVSADGIKITAKEFSPFSVSWKAPAADAPADESPSASPDASPNASPDASPDASASPSGSPAPGGRQNGGGPRTGDEANIALWIALLIVFAAGITVLLVVRRRKESRQ